MDAQCYRRPYTAVLLAAADATPAHFVPAINPAGQKSVLAVHVPSGHSGSAAVLQFAPVASCLARPEAGSCAAVIAAVPAARSACVVTGTGLVPAAGCVAGAVPAAVPVLLLAVPVQPLSRPAGAHRPVAVLHHLAAVATGPVNCAHVPVPAAVAVAAVSEIAASIAKYCAAHGQILPERHAGPIAVPDVLNAYATAVSAVAGRAAGWLVA